MSKDTTIAAKTIKTITSWQTEVKNSLDNLNTRPDGRREPFVLNDQNFDDSFRVK